MRTMALLATFCAALLIGCESASEPELAAPGLSSGMGPIVNSVSGIASNTRGTSWRGFSFIAWEYEDGTVQGQFQWHYAGSPNHGAGTVTCMTIEGNQAWIGGIITYHARYPEYVGLEGGFRVVDSGAGADAEAGLISYVVPLPYPDIPDVPDAQTYCNDRTEFPDLEEVESGDIQVGG